MQEEVRKTCQRFDIDPYKAISEGTLIATAKPERAKEVIKALEKEKILASIVGEVLPRKSGIIIEENNKEYKLEHPKIDPFWIRFEEYLRKQQQAEIKRTKKENQGAFRNF